MKFLLPVFLCSIGIGAAQQSATSPPVPPKLPELPGKTVVAVFDDGVSLTMGELNQILSVLPPQNQQMAMQQRKAFVEQWALMRKLAQMAEAEKLDQQSPLREQLLYSRLMVLSQAKIARAANKTDFTPEEISGFYEANKERYKEVRVKAIYVSFGPAAEGKKQLTEEEARQRALALLSQARSGADFVKLARENSDDVTSREKDGDFATLRTKDNIPDAIREAVFKLKQGELTEPVRQSNGYYILRAEEVRYQPLDQMRGEILGQLQQQYLADWLKKTSESLKVQFPEPAFLDQTTATPAPTR